MFFSLLPRLGCGFNPEIGCAVVAEWNVPWAFEWGWPQDALTQIVDDGDSSVVRGALELSKISPCRTGNGCGRVSVGDVDDLCDPVVDACLNGNLNLAQNRDRVTL